MDETRPIEKTLKRNLVFFKRSPLFITLGIILAAAGVVTLVLDVGFLYIIMPLLIFGGIGLIVFGSFGRSSETEIRDQIKKKTGEVTIDENTFADTAVYHGRVPADLTVYEYNAFLYSDEFPVRRGSNGEPISPRYLAAKLTTIRDAFHIKKREFSLIDSYDETEEREFLFNDVTDIRLDPETVEFTIGKTPASMKRLSLVFVLSDGTTYSLPRPDDATAEDELRTFRKACGLSY